MREVPSDLIQLTIYIKAAATNSYELHTHTNNIATTQKYTSQSIRAQKWRVARQKISYMRHKTKNLMLISESDTLQCH